MEFLYLIFHACLRLRFLNVETNQGLLYLQAWVCLGFYTRAADFYE